MKAFVIAALLASTSAMPLHRMLAQTKEEPTTGETTPTPTTTTSTEAIPEGGLTDKDTSSSYYAPKKTYNTRLGHSYEPVYEDHDTYTPATTYETPVYEEPAHDYPPTGYDEYKAPYTPPVSEYPTDYTEPYPTDYSNNY